MKQNSGRGPASKAADERLKYSFRFRMRLADGFFGIGRILSFGVPGYFVWKICETFGGKATTVSVSLVTQIAVSVSMASVAGVIAAWAKMAKQKKELVRCRERITELENHRIARLDSDKKG